MDLRGTIDPLEVANWDTLTERFEQSGIFHRRAWAQVLNDSYGFKTRALTSGPSDAPDAILPFVEVDSWMTGRRGVSVPFSDECEILQHDPEAGRHLVEQLIEHGRERRWRHWDCHGGHRLFPGEPAATSFHGHRLDLSPGYPALFARFDESVRRAVRKAEKGGLTVEFSRELDSVRAFHQLLGLTRRRHGIPLQPFEFFRQIHRTLLVPDLGFVALCRQGGRPIAGAVFLRSGRGALYKFGASDERQQQLRGNNLVMARAIEKLSAERCLSLDFGRTSMMNEGLRHFKRSWGTSERPLDYLRFSYRSNTFTTAIDHSSGLAQRLFRVAPVFLSRLVGRIIYKHIA